MELLKILEPWLMPIGVFILFILFCSLFHIIFLKLVRFLVDKLPINADANIAAAFDRPARIIILVLGLFTALNISPLEAYVQNVIVVQLVHTIVIFCIYWILYNIADSTNDLFIHILNKFGYNIDESLSKILSTCVRTLLLFLGFASIISAWGFDISGFIAGLSIGGLAVSLAAKDSLSNIFAGLIILVDKPFSVGDWIVCNNIEGVVESISFRSTNVRTFPQALVYIPNTLITNTPIINYTKRDRRRIDITLSVTYNTTAQQMKDLVAEIRQMLIARKDIYAEDLSVAFTNMNSSSLDIVIVCYCHFTDYAGFAATKEAINLSIINILQEVGASAAFPSTSIYIEKTPNKNEP